MIDLINYLSNKKIIIVCGHYGVGKTNISLNLSVKLRQQAGYVYTLVDLDVVNPYFRSADNIKDLQAHGIDFIIPRFANTNVDTPSVPSEIYSIFADNTKRAVIDVGGDDNGAVVLGMFADKIKNTNNNDSNDNNYEMIYVVNKYRNMTSDAESAVNLAKSIENKSKLKITSVINNSNLGILTTEKDIVNSFNYALKISESLNVHLIANTSVIDTDVKVQTITRIFNYTKNFF